MARSDFVLGRRACRAAFNSGQPFTTSVYTYRQGVRYTDPVTAPPSNKSRILYRIRVKKKDNPHA